MKAYEQRIKDAYDDIKRDSRSVYLTAKESEEGKNVLINIIHRNANVDKVAIMRYLNSHSGLNFKIKK